MKIDMIDKTDVLYVLSISILILERISLKQLLAPSQILSICFVNINFFFKVIVRNIIFLVLFKLFDEHIFDIAIIHF